MTRPKFLDPHWPTPISEKIKAKIKTYTLSIWKKIWWNFVPGRAITINFTDTPKVSDFIDQYLTDDQLLRKYPNKFTFCDWLTDNVGAKGFDWDIELNLAINSAIVKFRVGKTKFATFLLLQLCND